MPAARLPTPRLDLVPCSPASLAADGGGIDGRPALGRLLHARVPHNWPPELDDDDARRQTLTLLDQDVGLDGWALWYLVRRAAGSTPATAVGIAGYKGSPNDDGVVEVGYSVLRQFRRRGYASEAHRHPTPYTQR